MFDHGWPGRVLWARSPWVFSSARAAHFREVGAVDEYGVRGGAVVMAAAVVVGGILLCGLVLAVQVCWPWG